MLEFGVVWGSMAIRGGESGNDAGENDCLDGLHFLQFRGDGRREKIEVVTSDVASLLIGSSNY